jgi:hypothetical protein
MDQNHLCYLYTTGQSTGAVGSILCASRVPMKTWGWRDPVVVFVCFVADASGTCADPQVECGGAGLSLDVRTTVVRTRGRSSSVRCAKPVRGQTLRGWGTGEAAWVLHARPAM